jgi:hypothetical protein
MEQTKPLVLMFAHLIYLKTFNTCLYGSGGPRSNLARLYTWWFHFYSKSSNTTGGENANYEAEISAA